MVNKSNMPKNLLNRVCEALKEMGIPATVGVHSKAPAVVTEFYNIIYFQSSDSFRIFPDNSEHLTVKSSVKELLYKVEELMEGRDES